MIAGNNNLAISVVQLVKGMEKAFLGVLLAADKVDVVNQQHINTSILFAEFPGFPLLDGIYKLIGKLLGADIKHPKLAGEGNMTNGMQQVGLAQTHIPTYKQGVMAASRVFRYPQGTGISQAVIVADDEGIKGIF